MKLPPRAYTIFHLNLAYSSIEEEQHSQVIEACYWPLLKLAKSNALPLGLEATGYTLERIASLAPDWLAELKALMAAGMCEFVGSGLAQIIGPLVPAEVVEANLWLGNQVYERLLGCRPQVAMLNEQVFSAGVLPAYAEAGFRAVVMEWENPAAANQHWPPQVWAVPCAAAVRQGAPMPLLWNSSITNQKLQRLAHGDLNEDEYLAYIKTLAVQDGRALPLYGGDAEVFNHRPGRYKSEAPLRLRDEWGILASAFTQLCEQNVCRFALPSRVLEAQTPKLTLRMETAAQPLPVKKQHKYNPTRWAATGRDDTGINTACWRLFHSLRQDVRTDPDAWRELCLFWASDYRTHITASRWEKAHASLQARLLALEPAPAQPAAPPLPPLPISVARENRFLVLQAGSVALRLNMRKGLAIDAAWFKDVHAEPLFGTVPHGYFDDLSLAADFFSGHLVLERVGHVKETDLEIVEPEVEVTSEALIAACTITQFAAPLRKTVRISRLRPEITLEYSFDWPALNHCSLRLGHLTLLPGAFDAATLAYATHNGGRELEHFDVNGQDFNHGQRVSSLVSASQCLGMTQGRLWIGDTATQLEVEMDQTIAAAVPMVLHRQAPPGYLFRCFFSLRETDETSTAAQPGCFKNMGGFSLTIRARKTDAAQSRKGD